MTTSSDLLHSAAAKLRANADGATPGPLDLEIANGIVRVADFNGNDSATTGPEHDAAAIADARHYASWPPEAAVSLADWLDAAADRGDPDETASGVALCRVLLDGAPMLDDYDAALRRG